MAGFSTKTFMKHDDYCTPDSAWDAIRHLIPPDSIIWEPFYCDGKSGTYIESMGFKTIHKKEDFFTYEPEEYTLSLSNPPFSAKKEVFTRLKKLGKPFIMICPSSMINTQYIRQLFSDGGLQIVIPRKRIQFIKDGKESEGRCNFDCFYYCYKMDLPQDIIWLEK